MGKQCPLHWNHVISTTDVISIWEVPVPYRVSYQGVEFGRGTNSGKVASKQWSFLRWNCDRHGLDLEEDLSVTVWQPLLSSFSLLFNSWNVVNVESLSFPLYRVNIVCCSFSVVRVFHVLLLFLWLKTFLLFVSLMLVWSADDYAYHYTDYPLPSVLLVFIRLEHCYAFLHLEFMILGLSSCTCIERSCEWCIYAAPALDDVSRLCLACVFVPFCRVEQ